MLKSKHQTKTFWLCWDIPGLPLRYDPSDHTSYGQCCSEDLWAQNLICFFQ